MSENKSRFATVVPTIEKFPLPIMILGSLLLLVNVFGFFTFLFNLSAMVPEIGTNASAQAAGILIAGRQLAVTVVFALALFGKNVRFMQLAWFLAFIREIADAASMVVQGNNSGLPFFAALLIAEIAAFIYLGAIASGHVTKYLPSKK